MHFSFHGHVLGLLSSPLEPSRQDKIPLNLLSSALSLSRSTTIIRLCYFHIRTLIHNSLTYGRPTSHLTGLHDFLHLHWPSIATTEGLATTFRKLLPHRTHYSIARGKRMKALMAEWLHYNKLNWVLFTQSIAVCVCVGMNDVITKQWNFTFEYLAEIHNLLQAVKESRWPG